MDNQSVHFTLNGKEISVSVEPFEMLADTLRDRLNLTGTKKGCGQGECGACTVIMDGAAVNSCMVPSAKAEGSCVVTIEGLGENGKIHPIQQAFVDAGMILSTKALLDEKPNPTKEEIRTALAGNICRCTGYVKIEEAVEPAAAAIRLNNESKAAEGRHGG